jgi:hypothetical protein
MDKESKWVESEVEMEEDAGNSFEILRSGSDPKIPVMKYDLSELSQCQLDFIIGKLIELSHIAAEEAIREYFSKLIEYSSDKDNGDFRIGDILVFGTKFAVSDFEMLLLEAIENCTSKE